ncbi:hypothetical protein GWI33_003901 [Rhynchophorus ferrugineus]|uniref:Peptidase S1 domain-containing protein n=1 Tax=Rhynchophorus ferrugineus TaxID=354439 RepID=A0A834MN15_RHYFE|nr:hypothetical protein GWI33_003901 [Rhynchophorus ferrugineus]
MGSFILKFLVVCLCLIALAHGQNLIPQYYPAEPTIFDNSTLRVVAGQDASRNQFPYQISLRLVSGIFMYHICGGSIISQRWVLSAAHCTSGRDASAFRVTAGILIQTDSGIANQQTVAVSQITNHASYPGGNSVSANDICVIRLASLLTYGSNVQPIALALANSNPSGTATLSGWGSIGPPTNAAATTLQFVNIPILAQAQCASVIASLSGANNPFRSDLNVCTTTRTSTSSESACSGDSGGPLVVNNRLVGIVSWGYTPCGSPNIPSVYVHVAAYLNWISANTAGEVIIS